MKSLKLTLLTAALALAAAFTLSCSGDDGENDGNPAVSSSSENADVSSSSEQENNYSSSSHIIGISSSSSEQSEISSSSYGLDIENSSSSNITDISSSSEQAESSSSSSSLVAESSSSSSNATVSSSSERIENSSSSSGLGTDISSSEQENNSSSSSNITNSSSSEQAGKVCAALNNYNMAVEMNLNGEPVVVRKNGEVLVEGVNYEVIETQNTVKVQGLLGYIGSVERGSATVNALELVVRDGTKVLAEGTDYEVINTGSFIKFVGINDYAGSVEVELPCEPEPSSLGYFGNMYSLNTTFWELMADPNSDIWTGASNQGTYRNMDLPNYNEASTTGFKSFEVAKPGNTPITFTKNGYTFIALPAELGYPSRINNALGLDVKEVCNRSEKIIKGNNYIVYERTHESFNIGPDAAATETIIY